MVFTPLNIFHLIGSPGMYIRGMLHDPNTFGPDPEDFVPERFFKPGVPDPTIAFGFGRR
jgi:cytochrome P450